jgi:hypothetical protein
MLYAHFCRSFWTPWPPTNARNNYGTTLTSGHTGIHFPDTDLGPLHHDPDGDLVNHSFVPLVDSGEHTGGFLPHTDLEKPYWEVLGKKK